MQRAVIGRGVQLVCFCLAAVACHSPTAGGVALMVCAPWAPTAAGPYEAVHDDSVPDLAGDYDLLSVYASGGARISFSRMRLRLVRTDSAYRALASPIAERPTWLAGSVEWLDTITGAPLRGSDTTPVYRDTAQIEGSALYIGCRRCLDGSPVRYRILAVTAREFWGYWEDPQTGITRVADSTGRWLPNPAGHYCARRR